MLASELPVYQETYKLVSFVTDLSVQLPRSYKHSIGQKMLNVSLELFEYIQLANTDEFTESRLRYLTGFQIKFELLKVLIKLCMEKRIITLNQSAELAKMTTSIGKQITGWKKNINNSRNP